MRSENMFSMNSRETEENQNGAKDDSLMMFDNTAPKLVSIDVPSARKDSKKGDS